MKLTRLLICTIIAIVGSCSIKEDRIECPCWLTIDFSRVNPSVKDLHVWFFDGTGGILQRDTIYPDEYNNPYEIEIKRDLLSYHVWGNIGSGTEFTDYLSVNSALVKKTDLSADELFSYHNRSLSTVGESTTDTVILNKEFANVNFTLKGAAEIGDDIYLEFTSNTAGQYIDRRPIGGTSKTKVTPVQKEGNSLFHFRIIRQEETYIPDMKITLMAIHDGRPQVMENFQFGAWLMQAGYDMAAKNLEDIEIELDLSFNIVTITVANWQTTIPVNIEI